MGTWEGHISPGVAFYSFGLLYCVQNSWFYFTQGKKFRRTGSRSRTAIGRFFAKLRTFPMDAFMKIIYGFGAAMAELFYPPGTNKLILIDERNHWAHMNEWQHFTMYSFFMISGIVDIVSQKVLKRREVTLEKAVIAMAFYVTALLLFFHKHGKHEIENESHTLLLYANLGICASLTLEVWRPFDQKLIWLHTLLLMQMGSWLFHLAYIIFRPPMGVRWDENEMTNLMVLPIFYGWHVFMNCTVMAVIHLITWMYYKCKVNTSYSQLNNTELQCCIPNHSDDGDSMSGSLDHKRDFENDLASEKSRHQNGGSYRDVTIDEETAFVR